MHARTDWQGHFRAAVSEAKRRRESDIRIACGFTNNVDVLIRVDEDVRRTLVDQVAHDSYILSGVLPDSIAGPADLASLLLYHMRAGTGDVRAISSPEMAAWMASHFHGRYQLGGTGAQAANTLAHLGYRSLLHVTALSAEDAGVLYNSDRIMVATSSGLRPLYQAIRPGDRPMFHFVFEFQTGDSLRIGSAEATAPRANRIIVGYDPVNDALPIDPLFVKAIEQTDSSISKVLISGFTDVGSVQIARARIAEMAEHIARWRRARPGMIVHLELASCTDQAFMLPILSELAPHVDSIGFNEQELGAAMNVWSAAGPRSLEEQLAALVTLKERTGVARAGMHTHEYCLTLTDYDPFAERATTLFASLVAGTRARLGRFPEMGNLEETLETSQPSADTLRVEEQLAGFQALDAGIGTVRGCNLVFTPTLNVTHPAGTVGLGDSFTGGMLVMLEKGPGRTEPLSAEQLSGNNPLKGGDAAPAIQTG